MTIIKKYRSKYSKFGDKQRKRGFPELRNAVVRTELKN